MRKFHFLLLFAFCQLVSFAQVGVNATGANPDPRAMLDISSTSKGLLPPRMTTTERNSIVDPPAGLHVYNTTTNCDNFFNGTSWKQLCGECDFPNPVAESNSPLCSGLTLQLSVTDIAGATYSWTGPNGFISSEQDPTIPGVTETNSGVYYVAATLNGCTSASQLTSVTVSPLSAGGNTSPSASSFCESLSTSISLSNYSGSIQWEQSADNNAWNPVTGGSGSNSSVYTTPTLTSTTFYRAMVTSGTCGPVSSDVATISETKATGGLVTSEGGYTIHTFLTSGTFTPADCLAEVEVLVVGGGGGGGYDVGGGGGAGGLIYESTYSVTPLQGIAVTVGSGGLGSDHTGAVQAQQNGGNSVFSGLTAFGGGSGGNYSGGSGASGGSGGGASGYTSPGGPGSGSPGQGNGGGSTGGGSNCWTGGGGGGAGGIGGGGICNVNGYTDGGLGLTYSISGSPIMYARGGKGGGDSWNGTANAAPNTGNGGDGAGGNLTPPSGYGGSGGSGIVVVRYLN